MIARILASGLLAGLFAGLAIATLQHVTTTPIILAAEVYEKAAEGKKQAALYQPTGEARLILVHGGEDHGAGAEVAEWEPQDGLERTLFTSTATIATATGFALLLLAAMLASGDKIDERRAVGWAAAGFVATGLAPGIGLAPELPGMAAAELGGRQLWWFGTALATAGAIWLMLRTDKTVLKFAGVALLIAPHVFGAPHLAEIGATAVPAELAARFAATSLAVHAALWVLAGFLAGLAWRKLDRVGAQQPS